MTLRRNTHAGFTLVELLVVIAIIGILVALLLPAVQAAREAGRRSQCSNNFKQLGLAVQNYHDTLKAIPPGTAATSLNTAGPAPGAMSWMIYLLPYMEQQPLYNQLSPYFSTTNSADFPSDLMNSRIPGLVCPSDGNSPQDGLSHGGGSPPPDNNDGFIGNYLGSAGTAIIDTTNSTNLNGVFYYRSKVNLASVTDGLSNTMFFSEVRVVPQGRDWRGRYYRTDHLGAMYTANTVPNPRNTDGTLTADQTVTCEGNPGNPSYAPCSANGSAQFIAARSYHPGGVQIALGDGSARFISQTVSLAVWQALATRNGGEVNTSDN